jgi:hypothetical protein
MSAPNARRGGQNAKGSLRGSATLTGYGMQLPMQAQRDPSQTALGNPTRFFQNG